MDEEEPGIALELVIGGLLVLLLFFSAWAAHDDYRSGKPAKVETPIPIYDETGTCRCGNGGPCRAPDVQKEFGGPLCDPP